MKSFLTPFRRAGLNSYAAAMRSDLKKWRKKTGGRSKDWKPPMSFQEWIKTQLGIGQRIKA